MPKVLIVDDELSIRELLCKALAKNGFEAVSVPDGAQAFSRLFNEPFDLIVLDLRLARDSGMALLKKIRESKSSIPVVIYSGAVTEEIEKETRLAGATEVISKAVEIPQVISQIRKIIGAREAIFAGPASVAGKTILIVDDEEGIRSVLARFFKSKGYTVLEAQSGARALELAAGNSCSVALLDVKMPDMDGLQTLKRLKEVSPGTGVVMVTGEEGDEKVKEAIAQGAYGYVLKPFDLLYLELVVTAKLAIAGR